MTAAGVTLTLDVPEQPLTLHADATRISQVFLNLLTNAAKFTSSGGEVSVVVKPHVDRVSVVVRDSGIGIAPEDQDRVFGMFVQLNRDMRRSQTGLGIGLTLVKQMTELHGGSVAVWSEGLGKGTEFTITCHWPTRCNSRRRAPPRIRNRSRSGPSSSWTTAAMAQTAWGSS